MQLNDSKFWVANQTISLQSTKLQKSNQRMLYDYLCNLLIYLVPSIMRIWLTIINSVEGTKQIILRNYCHQNQFCCNYICQHIIYFIITHTKNSLSLLLNKAVRPPNNNLHNAIYTKQPEHICKYLQVPGPFPNLDAQLRVVLVYINHQLRKIILQHKFSHKLCKFMEFCKLLHSFIVTGMCHM